MIERHPTLDIMPMWTTCLGDRYVSHPALRTAIIQMQDEPEAIYCVADETLPHDIDSARVIVQKFRDAEGRSEE